jgi:tetrahydromethanopterin S-methyltransferase subunit G
MSAQPSDVRLSALEASVEHLNGAYEQIDKRLGDLRSDVNIGFGRVDRHFETIDRRLDGLDRKVDGNLRTLVGWMLGQTAVVIGAIANVALALRH